VPSGREGDFHLPPISTRPACGRAARSASVPFAVLGLALLSAGPASAAIVGFDLESLPVSTGNPSVVTTAGGVTLTLVRAAGGTLNVENLTPSGPSSFGARSLSPFNDTANAADYLVGTLSASFDSLSLQFGDFGTDSDTVTLTGYSGPNGTGTAVATATVNYGTTAFPVPGIILTAASGMQSFTLSSTSTSGPSTFYNSLYYDNFVVTTVPEPTAAAALLAAGTLLRRVRRERPA
jgi:hypothetical protein